MQTLVAYLSPIVHKGAEQLWTLQNHLYFALYKFTIPALFSPLNENHHTIKHNLETRLSITDRANYTSTNLATTQTIDEPSEASYLDTLCKSARPSRETIPHIITFGKIDREITKIRGTLKTSKKSAQPDHHGR